MTKQSKMMDDLEAAVGPVYLKKRIIDIIYKRQRDIVDVISQVHPMYSDNLFRKLREAIIEEDGESIEKVLQEINKLSDDIPAEVQGKLLDLLAILTAFRGVLWKDEDGE